LLSQSLAPAEIAAPHLVLLEVFGKFASAFPGFFTQHGCGTVSVILSHAHDISKLAAGNASGFLGLFLPFFLLSLLSDDFAPFPTEHCHIALRIANCGDWVQLLGENGFAVKEWGLEVVDHQMHPCSLFVVFKILSMIPALGHTRSKHAICFPGIDILLLLCRFRSHPLPQLSVCQLLLSLPVRPRGINTSKGIMGVIPEGVPKFISCIPVSVEGVGIGIVYKRFRTVKFALVGCRCATVAVGR
jgi:hypothetical protein